MDSCWVQNSNLMLCLYKDNFMQAFFRSEKMKNFKKISLMLTALFALPTAHAYQCKIDLQSNYSGSSVYINSNSDTYATFDYDDGRYDTMEYVYDLKNCKKVSDGVKQKSNISSVLSQNGFREIDRDEDISPWLTHYYSLNKQRDDFVFRVDELGSQEKQGLRDLFAYSLDKSHSFTSAASAILNTKYAKMEQFKTVIASRYLQSQNFARYASNIEQKLINSPLSLKNDNDFKLFSAIPFKLVAQNTAKNVFKITLEPVYSLNLSKVPTIEMAADCRNVATGSSYSRTVSGGFFDSNNYEQTVVDKTERCTLNGYSSSKNLEAGLESTAKMLGLSTDISLRNNELGTNNKTDVLDSKTISQSPSNKAFAQCLTKREMCKWECKSGRDGDACRKSCDMIHVCAY